MNDLATEILEEPEFHVPPQPPDRTKPKMPSDTRLKRSREIIEKAAGLSSRLCLAFSGGSDSLVLLDLTAKAGYDPIIIWVDTQMEYPGTRAFIEETVAHYRLTLRTAKSRRTPLEQWAKTGWPMLGKMAARVWMQQNAESQGFKINVSECCRAMKINPARQLTRNLGCKAQLTGQRGAADDRLRGFRKLEDGVVFFQKRDRIWIANPLTDWTGNEIQGYLKKHKIQEHPARVKGTMIRACIYCGGGCQYTNSSYRILRKALPEQWHKFMVEWRAGYIILAIKYRRRLEEVFKAVTLIGGLPYLANLKPYVFDFSRKKPLNGYYK